MPISEVVVYCPRCQSRNVKRERMAPVEPIIIPMDDLAIFNPAQYEPLVLQTVEWRATCNECGYYVTYQGV